MTRGSRAPATRSSLMRSRRRLAQVRKGAALLKRKRESLVDELFSRARKAVTSREGIDAQAREAWKALWEALARRAPKGWRRSAGRCARSRWTSRPWSCGA